MPLKIRLKKPKKEDVFAKRIFCDWKVDNIKDIIQNGPATILITRTGEKTVVKAQSEDFCSQLGFQMVLLRYLYSPKIYHDLVCFIFGCGELDNVDRMRTTETAIIAKIGYKTYIALINAFIERNWACK